MKLIARKPCSFEGVKYFIGDEIPAEAVINPKAMEQMGVLAIAGDNEQEKATIDQPQISKVELWIHAKEGDLPLNVTVEGLQAVIDTLTATASEAEPIIEQMTDEDALILLDCCDSRKTIREAARDRAKALNEGDA